MTVAPTISPTLSPSFRPTLSPTNFTLAPTPRECIQSFSLDQSGIINTILLFILMFGCGMAISIKQFKNQFTKPLGMTIAMFGQFVALPFLAWLVSKIFSLAPAFAAGLIVMTTAPGGSTSNIYSVLFQSDVPLSIAATAFSSFLAVGLMPLNQFLYLSVGGLAGDICIQIGSIVFSAFIVFLGVIVGLFTKPLLQSFKWFRMIKFLFLLGSLSAVVIIALAFYSNLTSNFPFYRVPGLVAGAAIITFCAGSLFGLVAARLCRLSKPAGVTIMFEVGIQNAFVAAAIIQVLFPLDRSDAPAGPKFVASANALGAAISAPAIYGIFGLIISPVFGLIAWKCGQTNLDPKASFIQAFRDAEKQRHKEEHDEIYGENDDNATKIGQLKVADDTKI